MDNNNISMRTDRMALVASFFVMLGNLPDTAKVDLLSDPHTYEMLEGKVTASAVYHLYQYHRSVLTAEMVDVEMSYAMYDAFDRGVWAEKYLRADIIAISEGRAAELKQRRLRGKAANRLKGKLFVNPSGKVIY